ncbi:DUF167 domain-containing protein [Hydrogenimonas sp.]
MWYDVKENEVELSIQARPGSSRNEIVGVFDDSLKVKVKAPAVEGAANKELVKFLAKRFRVPKSEVAIVAGATAKRKRVRLPRSPELMEWLEEMRE